MTRISERFKCYVMSFTFKERRTRELINYRKRVSDLKQMEADELDFEYITMKSEFEHKKSVLAVFIISVALAILMNVWNYFFIFIEKALQYSSTLKSGESGVEKVSFAISLIVVGVISFVILYVLITYMKEIYKIQKELLIIEVIRKKESED